MRTGDQPLARRTLLAGTAAMLAAPLQGADPGAAGLVQSLARPGTNVTGMSSPADGAMTKNVEALLEIVPRAERVALLCDAGWSGMDRQLRAARDVARSKGAEIEAHPVINDEQSVRSAFAQFERRRPDGLVIDFTGATATQAGAILAGVRAMRLPATGYIPAGALALYGVDLYASVREAADFVDHILRGAKPADLPGRQSMVMLLTVNLKLARELGIELPMSLRLRADRVIE